MDPPPSVEKNPLFLRLPEELLRVEFCPTSAAIKCAVVFAASMFVIFMVLAWLPPAGVSSSYQTLQIEHENGHFRLSKNIGM